MSRPLLPYLSCNHAFKHLKMLPSIVPGCFIVRCMTCDLQNMYRFDETQCLTAKRTNELEKNIGIVQTELDKARLVTERRLYKLQTHGYHCSVLVARDSCSFAALCMILDRQLILLESHFSTSTSNSKITSFPFFYFTQKPFSIGIVQGSDVLHDKFLGYGDIVTNIFMDFDYSFTPDSFESRLGIINTIGDDILFS